MSLSCPSYEMVVLTRSSCTQVLQFQDDQGRDFEMEMASDNDSNGEEQEANAHEEDHAMQPGEDDEEEGVWKEEALREYRDDSLRCFPHAEPCVDSLPRPCMRMLPAPLTTHAHEDHEQQASRGRA